MRYGMAVVACVEAVGGKAHIGFTAGQLMSRQGPANGVVGASKMRPFRTTVLKHVSIFCLSTADRVGDDLRYHQPQRQIHPHQMGDAG